MWRRLSLILPTLLLVAAFGLLAADHPAAPLEAAVGGAKLRLEVAATAEERQRGLMERPELCADCGMLFDFGQPGRYGMWMERTLVPLDMWWLNEQRQIVWIEENVPPDPCGRADCDAKPVTVRPEVTAQFVIELPAGTSQRLRVKDGDQVRW